MSGRGRAPWLRAVIFDFDGVLVETESTLFESWRYEWEQWGLTLEPQDFAADHGGDISEIRHAKLAAAVGPSYDQELSARRRRDYRNGLHENLGLAIRIGDWIQEAHDGRLLTAIAS